MSQPPAADTTGAAPAPAPAPAIPAADGAAPPRQYKRLNLAKRSVKAPVAGTASRSSIFGAAKPRELVLKEKGIDVQEVEKKLEKLTARLPRMNRQQEEEFQVLEAQLASAKKKAAAEDASVDDKAAAEAEVEKLSKERAEFIEARKKEELEFARKRREQQREEASKGGNTYSSGGYSGGRYGDNNRGGNRDGGYGNRRYGGNRDRRDNDNNNGGDFSNFESNRNRGGRSYGGSFGGNSDNRDGGSFNRDSNRGGDSNSFGNRDRGSFGGSSGGGSRSFGGNREGKLFVGQLDYSTTSQGLEDAFSRFGALEECTVILDRYTQQSRGFGFVTFKDPAHAAAAIEALNGQNLDGRSIIVRASQ